MKILGTRSFTRAALARVSLVVFIAAAAFGVRLAQGQGASARMVVDEAAKALGGVDRLRSVKNITLVGYGQNAAMIVMQYPAVESVLEMPLAQRDEEIQALPSDRSHHTLIPGAPASTISTIRTIPRERPWAELP